MRHHTFTENEQYHTALLLKGTAFNKAEIIENYVDQLELYGIHQEDLIAFTLKVDDNGKTPAAFVKSYLTELLPILKDLGVKHLYVTEAAYFKTLTKQTKAEPFIGYSLPCKIAGYEGMKVVYGINYRQLIYNPALSEKLSASIKTLSDSIKGTYVAVGTGIIHSAHYPGTYQGIKDTLRNLMSYPELSADIEAFSLSFDTAGIGTIAFSWDKNNGTAFPCDYKERTLPDKENIYGDFVPNQEVRALLKGFLTHYPGKLVWHSANYDLKVILYTLWMKDALDMEGLLEGLEVLTRLIDDTKIIAYLALNSTAGNNLRLKELAQSFAGNWAVDEIKDIRKIPLSTLLQYNLVDTLSTCYVKEKLYPVMVADEQLEVYESIMLPSIKTILQMELCGMPMDMEQVQVVKEKLQKTEAECLDVLTNSPVIRLLNVLLQTNAMNAANAKLKTKVHPLENFQDLSFNPNSGPQMQVLLYEHMGLPILDFTATKQAATGADTLEKLINHTDEPAYKQIIEALLGYAKINKILTSFIPAFEKALKKGDGWSYLHGSFNLGGTVSGRLSSSDPK